MKVAHQKILAHPLDILTYHKSPINDLANKLYKIAVEV